ncbi:hypothetical protein IHQ68_10090 [Chelatococcus sambhunathii]|uniref:Uncharacterized protein n=1 Tax=Chelatococcus sambhunathii TaxID=363953 RepID=A0ABU1DFT4_9HYPH|nr:hypothetical protein [Chelatococcus sambhunathii]MDR4306967.1 hypothetical protein [Chelatococcus sambhunathii]
MLSRLSWTPAPVIVRRPVKRRLNRDRRQHLVVIVVAIMRAGDPTPFAFEATCRHAIRSRLCLSGWRWSEADAVALDIVLAALRQIGAQRPTWKQGQPEWTQDGHSPIERTRCVRCGSPLPEDHTKFCGRLCGDAHNMHLAALRQAEDGVAYDRVANRNMWSQSPEARRAVRRRRELSELRRGASD